MMLTTWQIEETPPPAELGPDSLAADHVGDEPTVEDLEAMERDAVPPLAEGAST